MKIELPPAQVPVYVVVSETLTSGGYYLEPPEWYCIAEIVAARNRSQARYMAWHHAEPSISKGESLREMPRFTVRKLGVLPGAPRVLPATRRGRCLVAQGGR